MRKHFIPIKVLWLILIMSCAEKKASEKPAIEWKEFDAFQSLIEKPFKHLKSPDMMDSVTIKTTVQLINSIADSAEKLADSPLADKMDSEIVKEKLQKLKTDTRALAQEIAEGTEDDVIGTNIYSIYTSFLEIKKAWEQKN